MSVDLMGNYLGGYVQNNNTNTASAKTASGTDATKDADKSTFTEQIKRKNKTAGKQSLDMNDFLKLMAVQLQNQDMNNPLSESEMMAQMAQMATVTAMTNMTDVSVTTYSASLVGKDVTLAHFDKENEGITQLVGKVTGAGLYAGQQIIFVGGKSYSLSQIMAIGELPDADEKAIRVDEKGEIISRPKPVEPEDPEAETDPEEGEETEGVETP